MLRSYPRGIIAENPPIVKHVGGVENSSNGIVVCSCATVRSAHLVYTETQENKRIEQVLIAQRPAACTGALG